MVRSKRRSAVPSQISLQYVWWQRREVNHHQSIEAVTEGWIDAESQYVRAEFQILTDEHRNRAAAFEFLDQAIDLLQVRDAVEQRGLLGAISKPWLFRKTVNTDRGTLTFTSTTELEPENRQLLLAETHTLVDDAGEHSSDYHFVMRCWTRTELESALERNGFGSVAYYGAYDSAVHAGATDRLIAVAKL